MNALVNEIIKETLDMVMEDLRKNELKLISVYESEANAKLPVDMQEKIHFKLGLLDDNLVMGYRDKNSQNILDRSAYADALFDSLNPEEKNMNKREIRLLHGLLNNMRGKSKE